MSYYRWINVVLSFIIAPVCIVALVNYVVDPFTVFHSNFMHYDFEMNERFNKIRHIDKHYAQYNSYLLGSSRMGTTSPELIEQYIPGSRFYNFTAAGSTQYDNELIFKYLLKKNYPIKNIYLQIDLSDIYGYEASASNYNAKHHPHVTDSSLALFYISYLSILPTNHLIQKIKVNFLDKHQSYLRHDIEHSGRWYADHLEAKIALDHEQYIRNEPSFISKPIIKQNKGTKIFDNITSIRHIKKLADANNIRLIVFITPHNKTMLETLDIDSYLSYLYEIAQITNYWDFSGYNSITLDHHYYYENSHYRTTVAELIAKKIFDDNRTPTPPLGFGHFVTQDNLAGYLATKKHRAINHQEIRLAQITNPTNL